MIPCSRLESAMKALIATIVSSLPGQLSLVAIGAFIAGSNLLHGIIVAISWSAVLVLTFLAFRRWRGARCAHDVRSRGVGGSGLSGLAFPYVDGALPCGAA